MALYPLALYLAITRGGARTAALLALGYAVARAAGALRGASRDDLLRVLAVPATIGAVAGLTALTRDARLLLAAPVLVNATLFAHFARSLGTDTPLVERFARMQVGELSPAERAWCRGVTVAWCAFFVVNGTIAGALALAAPPAWWALYTGVISYGLMAAVFTVEFVARSYRFRRYGTSLPDRVMARIFPPRA